MHMKINTYITRIVEDDEGREVLRSKVELDEKNEPNGNKHYFSKSYSKDGKLHTTVRNACIAKGDNDIEKKIERHIYNGKGQNIYYECILFDKDENMLNQIVAYHYYDKDDNDFEAKSVFLPNQVMPAFTSWTKNGVETTEKPKSVLANAEKEYERLIDESDYMVADFCSSGLQKLAFVDEEMFNNMLS